MEKREMLGLQPTALQCARDALGHAFDPDRNRADGASGNLLLELFPQPEAAALVAHSKVVQLKKRQLLMQTGEAIDYVHFPRAGMISLIAALPDGKALEVASIGREGALGVGSALGRKTAIAQAVVQVPGLALRVPAHAFAMIADGSKFLQRLAALYNDALAAQFVEAVACTAFHDVQARLCRYLLQARDCVGSTTLPMTQEMISEALGVRRTTVTLIAGTLQSLGVVSYQRGAMEICDETALQKLACPCCRSMRGRIMRDLSVMPVAWPAMPAAAGANAGIGGRRP